MVIGGTRTDMNLENENIKNVINEIVFISLLI